MASNQNHIVQRFLTHYVEYVKRPGNWILGPVLTFYVRDVPFSKIIWC